MRRRRQKNTLLPKMIGLAVLINAILLPILARFGAFKSIGGPQRITPIELVRVPPTPKPPAPPKKTAKKQAAKPHPAAPKAAARTVEARRAPGPPAVRVVAVGSGTGGPGSGGDSGIAPSDALPPPPGPPPSPSLTMPPPPPAPTQTLPVLPPAPPLPVSPPPAPPPAPRVPTLTAAVPLSQPRPSIPDELRDADLNGVFDAQFTVHSDGTATVKVVSGTGNATLDALALDAAKRWTFRPATRDGQPVESYLRLRVEFTVDS